jgi:hypothetical protein
VTNVSDLPADDAYLVERVAKINNLARRSLADHLKIGELLDECKRHIQPGFWLHWLHERLGIRQQTAGRYIRAFKFSQTVRGQQLVGFGAPYFCLSLLHTAEDEDIDAVLKLAQSKGVAPQAEVVQSIIARTRAIDYATRGTKFRGHRVALGSLPPEAAQAIRDTVGEAIRIDALRTIKKFIRDHRAKSDWNKIATEAIGLLAATIDKGTLPKIEGTISKPLVAAE